MNDEGYQPFPDISAWTAVPFDSTTYDQYAALLEQARAEATEEAREHAVRTAIRYAGTDTGAIEGLYTTDRGFTRTVAIEAAHWEAAANERGPNAAAIIKDQIEAYEWVLDLVTESRPVTEHVIRELHAMLCRSQDTYVVHTELGRQEHPLPKGEYKKFPNNPTSAATGRLHHYAPPDMVAPEMARLVTSLSSDEYAAGHPVVQAAYLHYSLAAIHPFADGNGRVSRAIASVPLYRELRAPLVVLCDQRDEYFDALERADAGSVEAFVRFVAARVVDVIDLVMTTTRVGRSAAREKSLDSLRRTLERVRGAPTTAELDAAAHRLADAVRDELTRQTAEVDLPEGVTLTLEDQPSVTEVAKGDFRFVAGTAISVHVDEVASGVAFTVACGVASRITERPLLLTSTTAHSLVLGLSDVTPALRAVTHVKISKWVSDVVDETIAAAADLADKAAKELRRST